MRNLAEVIPKDAIQFRLSGTPGQASAESESSPASGVRSPILKNLTAQGLRGCKERGVIESRQRLERGVGAHAPYRAELTCGRVKGSPTGVRRCAPDKGVKRTAV